MRALIATILLAIILQGVTVATEFIPVQDMKEIKGSSEASDLQTLIGAHAKRLGVDKGVAYNNALDFADIVALVESSGDARAKSKESTASGTYQYVADSVEPAVKRLEKYIGMRDWMKSALMHKDASKLSPQQQTLLFLGDILEKEGSDKYMSDILGAGDVRSMEGAYMELHHTDPDIATIKNWARKISPQS